MFADFLDDYGETVLGGALFFAAAWFFAHWIGKIASPILLKRLKFDPSTATLVVRIARYAILVLAGIAVLQELGVQVTSIIAALGIFGFAIALGLRTTTTNFFTGVSLLILKPYTVGEHIEGERVEGVVESVNLFHTVVVTKDGTYVAVPNAAMWARSVRNFSRSRPRCIELDITLERGPPFEKIRNAIVQALRTETLIGTDYEPLIRIVDQKVKTLKIRVAVWCETELERDARRSASNALRAALAEAGVAVDRIVAAKVAAPKKRSARPAPAADDEL